MITRTLSSSAKLNVAGLVVAAAGILTLTSQGSKDFR